MDDIESKKIKYVAKANSDTLYTFAFIFVFMYLVALFTWDIIIFVATSFSLIFIFFFFGFIISSIASGIDDDVVSEKKNKNCRDD